MPQPLHAADRPLLPLPLVSFESMMLYDDRPEYPMTCGAEFVFDGQVVRSTLEAAFEYASRRHPLFSSNVAQTASGRWQWVPSDRGPSIHFVGDAEPEDYHRSAPVDLRRQVGLQLWVREQDNQTTLLFDFHHACSDGAGGLSFVEDLLTFYASAFANGRGRNRDFPKIDLQHLRRRGAFDPGEGSAVRRKAIDAYDFVEKLCLAFQRATPLEPTVQTGPRLASADGSRRLTSRTLSKSQTAAIRSRAGGATATLNDLMITHLFQSLRAWNHDQDGDVDPQRLRVCMPMNLRSRLDLEMPAANRMSYGFLTRKLGANDPFDTLLASIAAETSQLRRDRIPAILLWKLSFLKSLGFAWPLLFSPNGCLSTAVFSNVGDPTRRFRTRFPRDNGRIIVGNLKMTEFRGITPLRPKTRCTFFVNTYGGELTISARFDPHLFRQDDGDLFLDRFVARLADAPAASRARAA